MELVRSDSVHTTLPDYLRYKPYTVPHPCPGVEPRYLDPRKPKTAVPAPTFQPVTSFGPSPVRWNTPPRYLQARARTPEARPPPKYTELKEYEYHQRVARAAGFSNVNSRLLDPPSRTRQEDLSPRDRVQQQREENKRLTNWRSNPINGPSLTFDEIRQRNQHLKASFEAALAAKKNKTPSVVGDYCRHGTPVKHHTMSPEYVSKRKKDFEPRWTAAGGSGGGQWNRGSKGPVNRSTARSEHRVREYRTQSSERRVARRHVPRVATLAPSYSLQQWEASHGADGEGGDEAALDFDPNSSLSPAPAVGRDKHHQGGEDRAQSGTNGGAVEVIEGPVTVSVPRGAVVRVATASTGGQATSRL